MSILSFREGKTFSRIRFYLDSFTRRRPLSSSTINDRFLAQWRSSFFESFHLEIPVEFLGSCSFDSAVKPRYRPDEIDPFVLLSLRGGSTTNGNRLHAMQRTWIFVPMNSSAHKPSSKRYLLAMTVSRCN